MPSFKRPGVYVEEVLGQSFSPSVGSLSAGAIHGAHNRGPVSEPTLVTSFSEYKTVYGGFEEGDLSYAAYLFFRAGGQRLYVNRVEGSGAAAGTRVLNDRAGSPLATLQVDALNSGEWGNSIYIEISDGADTDADTNADRFNLIVYFGGSANSDIVERWMDLSMDSTDDRYVENVINHVTAGSNYISVADQESASAHPENIPAVQAATVLTGGSDGTAPNAAAIEAAINDFDVVAEAFALNLPNIDGTSTIDAATSYAEGRGDVFVFIDPAVGATVAGIQTTQAGYAVSSYGALYFPRVWFSDPNSAQKGALRLLPPGAAVMGMTCRTDDTRGVWKAPAGLSARLAGAVALETKLTSTDLDDLNDGHVNAIRNVPGAGIVVMGARTLKTYQIDRYVPVRRTLNYVKSSISDLTGFAVFEPNDQNLWNTINARVGEFLRDLWNEGGLAGNTQEQAFYVKCDADLNTQQVIDAGEVKLEVGVALLQPAEFVVLRVGQWQGGSSVNES